MLRGGGTEATRERNELITEALERYRGLIWRNCNRYGARWAEDAYQQMVTKALARRDLLYKDVDSLGRKLCSMALTEAAHMARSQKRGDAAVRSLGLASATTDAFEARLLAFDAWRDMMRRVPEDKALAYSLKKQGFHATEIAASLSVDEGRAKRIVREVEHEIDQVLLHLEVGICAERAELLNAYAHDASSRHGASKLLDRRVRSRLKAHIQLCDTCREYSEKARSEVDQLVVVALPAALAAEGKLHMVVDWTKPGEFLGLAITRLVEKVKSVAIGLAGRAEQASQLAFGASSSGLGPGRVVAACGTAVACLAASAWQGGTPAVTGLLQQGRAGSSAKGSQVTGASVSPVLGQSNEGGDVAGSVEASSTQGAETDQTPRHQQPDDEDTQVSEVGEGEFEPLGQQTPERLLEAPARPSRASPSAHVASPDPPPVKTGAAEFSIEQAKPSSSGRRSPGVK